MLRYILIILLIVIVYYFYSNKIRIKWKTFFRKGFNVSRGPFGVYCYDGKQGNFKTYSCIETLLTQYKDKPIYSNITSLKGVEYTPIGDFDDLLKLRDKTDCIIVFDEIFTALTRNSRMSTQVLDFLSQMRKRRIIFITTAQEWLEINITLRRYCRYRIHCETISLGFMTLIKKSFYDAENMKWSNEENEYVAPLLQTTISKPNLYVAQSYDTYEQIHT